MRKLNYLKLAIINIITLSRLFGALLLPIIYLKYGMNYSSIMVIILFLTDSVDGFLARELNSCTFFGAYADALCDKILSIVSFIILLFIYKIVLIPIILEILIILVSYNTYRNGGNVKSSIIGKIKTAILDLTVIFSYILLSLPMINTTNKFIIKLIHNTNSIISVITIITIIFEIVTLTDYVIKNINTRKNPKIIKIKYKKNLKKSKKEILHDLFDTNYYLVHKNESIIKQLYK